MKAEITYFLFGQMMLNTYIRKISSPTFLLRYLGAKIGDDSFIWPGITINCENRNDYKLLNIGDHARILWDVTFDLNDEIIIGDYVHIGANSMVITHHSLGNSPLGESEFPPTRGRVVFERGAAISWGCIILQNSIIKEFSVVSAGSVVSGTLPSYSLFGGNPIRPIRKIDSSKIKQNR